MSKPSVPVAVDEEVTLTALRLGYQGEGVGKHEGFTVFVNGLLPGETARVRIIEAHASYARAKVVTRLADAPERAAPRCASFAVCGGCQTQHMTYAAELAWKRQTVVDALVRVGHFPADVVERVVEGVNGMDDPWRYRNKVTLTAAPKGAGFVAGFVEEGTHEPTLQTECLIRPELHDKLVEALVARLNHDGIAAYDEVTGRGQVRQIRVRSAGDGAVMVVLSVVAPLQQGEVIAKAIADAPLALGRVVGVVEEVVPLARGGRRKSNDASRVLWGAGELRERMAGLDFLVSGSSFLQVNPSQTEVLYRTALEFAQLSGSETVVDLYAGIGTLTLAVAQRLTDGGRALGVESVPDAVRDARRNAERNGLHQAEFVLGRAEEVLPRLVQDGLDADVILLDPPRAGCRPAVITAMAATGAGRIVYVSCNPATLARDLALLVQCGYELKRVQPVDLFPHTYHVETVVLMVRLHDYSCRVYA